MVSISLIFFIKNSVVQKFYVRDSRMQLSEMIALFQKLDTIKRMLVVEIIKLVKLILVVSKAVSEISFLSLKRIKTFFAQQQQIIG